MNEVDGAEAPTFMKASCMPSANRLQRNTLPGNS
jgi:hypothetical protein